MNGEGTLQAGIFLEARIEVEVMGTDKEAVERYLRWLKGPHDRDPEPGFIMPRDYSRCLATAWDLLVSDKSRFLHVRNISSRSGEDFRLCRNYPGQDLHWLEYMTPGGLVMGPEAETPAMAICAAALEACGKKEEESR